MTSDGDLRMLGAVDGFAHAMVRVRQTIGAIKYRPIHPRHVRKIAAREAKLKPLCEIEAWLVEQHRKTREAYQRTKEKGTP